MNKISRGKVIVVGSGISGIMTAWQAMLAGYAVEMISKSPDPRRFGMPSDREKESSTFDSKNDQRYITLFEGHPYLELDGYVNKVYPGIAADFEKGVLEGGVLSSSPDHFSESSQLWLEERSRLNASLLEGDAVNCAQVAQLFQSYTRENRTAMELWFEILIDLIQRSPRRFPKDLSLHSSGIVRLYDNAEVFDQSLASHQAEQVFMDQYTPSQLVEKYPAYQEGVERGFIAGGAIEIYGLAFAVGSFCRAILNELEQGGARLRFETEVKQVVLNEAKQVEGVMLFDEQGLRVAQHYVFHTGAFAGPELFEFIPAAKNKLAAVEGYWITIENAEELTKAMGDKPNKVHGKKSLEEILGMVDSDSAAKYRERFSALGVDLGELSEIAPIVDFNNMPIRKDGKVSLGVGSGYVFKGVGKRGEGGKVAFQDQVTSDQFVLVVMELWLEALHGKDLLAKGAMTMHPKGCKRSYTPNDKELDVNIPTTTGGLCMIHDGGNTGSTTKSPFIAAYILEKMRLVSTSDLGIGSISATFLELRDSLGKSAEEVPMARWQYLSSELNELLRNN